MLLTHPYCPRHTPRASPSPQKKTYLFSLSPSVSSRLLFLSLFVSPLSRTSCPMSALSRVHFSEDDIPPFRLGSNVAWSPAPSGNRSFLAGHDTNDPDFSDAAPVHYVSRHPGPSRLSAPQYRSHPTHVPEDRRSHSYISISSDDPDSAEAECIRLREEIKRLKTECRQLRNKLTDLTYVI